MNNPNCNLVTISESNVGGEVKQTANARELYSALGLDPKSFSRWAELNINANDFAVKGVDFIEICTMQNGRSLIDYALTIDFAKRLAMLARTAKGEQVRTYFLDCEKKAKESASQQLTLPKTYKEALIALIAEVEKVEALEAKLEEAAPALQFHDEIAASEFECHVGVAAKTLLGGERGAEKKLVAWMITHKWLTKINGPREATAYALQNHYMTQRVEIVRGRPYQVAMVTGKGLTLLRHLYRTGELFTAGIGIRLLPPGKE